MATPGRPGKEYYRTKIEALYREKPTAQGMAFIVGMSDAAGSNVDVDKMYSTFQNDLNFSVLRENNLHSADLEYLVLAAAETRYPLGSYKYIAFYFAGHGGIDDSGPFVQAYDGGHVDIHKGIIDPFKVAKSSYKFFYFFDCCLSGTDRTPDIVVPPNSLVAFATSAGDKSKGDKVQGGLWTSYLCENLKHDLPLINILSRTHEAIKLDHQSALTMSENIGEVNLKQSAKGGFSIKNKSPKPNHVFQFMENHSADWNDVGSALDVPQNERSSFARDNKLTDRGRMEKVLLHWNNAQCSEVTWGKIVEVVIRLHYKDTAMKIKAFLEKADTIREYREKEDFQFVTSDSFWS